MLDLVLFDIDGTLLDSNEAHAISWRFALRTHEIFISYEQIRKLIGMGGDQLLDALHISSKSCLAKKIEKERKRIYEVLKKAVRPFLGARQLVEYIDLQGYKIGVASSAVRKEVKNAIKLLGIGKYISFAISGEDVEHSKPQPDLIQASLKRSMTPPQRCLLIGDTPYDIQAAARTGVKTVALECGGWPQESLLKAGAVITFKCPQQFLNALIKDSETSIDLDYLFQSTPVANFR
jgi:HAD superfamily hydrolase (TIGR01549 family)